MSDIRKPKILVVDDEKDLCEILEFNLTSEGFETHIAHSAEDALKKSLDEFDLILLDVMMGGMSGYKLASHIRKEMCLTLPIIFITAKTSENEIITGFNVGGDDYISKPFSIKEMIVRIKAVLRRGQLVPSPGNILTVEGLRINNSDKTTYIENEPVNLTRKEFNILALLVRFQNQYVGREEILQKV